MKILLLSQVPPYFESHRKANQDFPSFQAQSFWLKALRSLGHSVKVFKYSDPVVKNTRLVSRLSSLTEKKLPRIFSKYRLLRNKYYQYWPDNRIRSAKLDRYIRSFRPNLIIISGGVSELSGSAIRKIDRVHSKIFLLHGVHPDEGSTKYERDFLKLIDCVITNDPNHARAWQKAGAKNAVAVPYVGIDPEYHTDLGLERKKNLLFLGTLFQERQDFFIELLSLRTDFELYGHLPTGVSLDPRLRPYYKGEVWGKEMVKLFSQAKMVINLVPSHMQTGGNMRTFEIPGCGSLQLANRCPSKWFEADKEIVLFSDYKELASKATYYLENENERLAIAKAGYQRAHKDHTYRQRFSKILKLVSSSQ